ncbi:MAG: cytochrome c [Methylococcaceae bacterium]|nr:cytochrome c [Methylococcaceae bacterium]
MQRKKLSLFILILSLTACSDDYTPRPTSSAKTIYLEACADCHSGEPENPEMYYWSINPKNINARYIAHKVNAGSLTMPGFPNIQGESMRKLSEYVLQHNLKK